MSDCIAVNSPSDNVTWLNPRWFASWENLILFCGVRMKPPSSTGSTPRASAATNDMLPGGYRATGPSIRNKTVQSTKVEPSMTCTQRATCHDKRARTPIWTPTSHMLKMMALAVRWTSEHVEFTRYVLQLRTSRTTPMHRSALQATMGAQNLAPASEVALIGNAAAMIMLVP